jgi:hypothetical protein
MRLRPRSAPAGRVGHDGDVTEPRHKRTVRLSEDARAGWVRVEESRGVEFTALVEALGLMLHERRADWVTDEVVALARLVAHQRKKR